MKLVVDNRERALIDALKARSVLFEVKQLDLGDIHFLRDDDTPMLVIERKTGPDLASSIKDGRWTNQKERLIILQRSGVRVQYLIEGPLKQTKYQTMPVSTLESALFNIQFLSNVMVHYPRDLEETCSYLETTLVRLAKLARINASERAKTRMKELLKQKKKDWIKADNFSIVALSQIPSFGLVNSKAIIARFRSIYDLCNDLCEIESDSECLSLLADVKTEGGHCIGPEKAQLLIDYLITPN